LLRFIRFVIAFVAGIFLFVAEASRFRLTTYALSVYSHFMKRTTVFLTDDQIKRLAKMATRKGINMAQLIRIYINAGLDSEKP
jgi:hypothetical protein